MIKLIGVIAIIGSQSILEGWCLSLIWKWHIAKVFNLPMLTISQAIGVSLTATLLTHQYIASENEEAIKAVLYCYTTPLVMLVMAYIVKSFQ